MNKTLVATIIALALAAPAAFAALPSGPIPGTAVSAEDLTERHLPRPVGVEKDMRILFGPFTIPPGQDNNRVSLDMPVYDGFITAIAPTLIDAQTGEEPSMLSAHIHHAHWFRVSDDPADEYYTLNLAWIFGTGEERTQGSFHDRAAADPNGPLYGIFIPGGQPQAYIYMIHNKESVARNFYITLDVTFAYGTRDQILAAPDCGALPLLEGERCLAGKDFHEVKGRLWGSTFDVPRDWGTGDGVYVHPIDIPEGDATRRETDDLGRFFVAPFDGTLIATAGHLHPNGMATVLANLGPEGSACEADLDGDGLPGVTLFNSRKLEHNPEAFPHSEDYQMAATKFGYRAPIRAGDRITQFGVYDNGEYASYEAMSYAGVYVDRLQPPAARGEEGCTLDNTQPVLIDEPGGVATEGILNHAWSHNMPLCGLPGWPVCDVPEIPREEGVETDAVHISAFAYLPGDMDLSGPLGAAPKVRQGESLTFVNEDMALGIRHTVSSCEWPCNGPYVANYPQPDGLFDSGKLGNIDYIDGGIVGDDTSPVWESPTDLEPGMYAYYCRIHPDMRGVFEVI